MAVCVLACGHPVPSMAVRTPWCVLLLLGPLCGPGTPVFQRPSWAWPPHPRAGAAMVGPEGFSSPSALGREGPREAGPWALPWSVPVQHRSGGLLLC